MATLRTESTITIDYTNGVVGPQIDSYAEETIYFDIFVSYKGGNQQYEIVLPKEIDWRGEDWEKYLKEIERLELK